MTEKEIEQRTTAFLRNGGFCFVCHKPLAAGQMQYAHRIANTKLNRQKYGSFIIDHTLNGELVCSLACNQRMNIGYNNGACLQLMADIVLFEMRKFQNAKK